jgi:hypothetical protein
MGSSGGGNAAREAEEQERRRQAQINQTTAQINSLFDSPDRQKQIADFQRAMQDFYQQDLGRQHEGATRNLKFALARSGLTGGSQQIDANRDLGESYQRGILESERRAQGAAANLRAQDEQTRANLTSMAMSGLSATNAATQAAAGMRASLEGAQAAAKADALGDLFGNIATIKSRSEEDAARRRADRQYTSMYGPYWSQFSGFGTAGGG